LISYGIWNAVNDPIAGHTSDRTRTRWGRRIPFILFGTLLVIPLFVLVWTPPTGGMPLAQPFNLWILFYLVIILALYEFLYTLVGVPYMSLFPEMFEKLEERTEVSIYQQVSAMIGLIIAFVATPLLAEALGEKLGILGGWTWASVILGLGAGGAFYISLLGSRERKEFSLEKALPFITSFKLTITNRSFLTFAVTGLMTTFVWSWVSAMVPFWLVYVLGAGLGDAATLYAVKFIIAMAFYPIWKKICLSCGSKKTFALSTSLYVAFLLPILVIDNLSQGIVLAAFLGVAISGMTIVRNIVLSDVIDEDEIKVGL